MASETLRNAFFALYTNSPILAGLGLTEATIYPNFSADAPPESRFMILRWGLTNPGMGRVNQVTLGCWVYNREPDYGPIAAALLEIRRLAPTMLGVRMSPTESVNGVDYNGDSDDLYDDAWRAYTRYTTHTITASGS